MEHVKGGSRGAAATHHAAPPIAPAVPRGVRALAEEGGDAVQALSREGNVCRAWVRGRTTAKRERVAREDAEAVGQG